MVTVSDKDWLFPTVMLPKLRVVGLDPSVPGATPVPDRGMVSVGFDAVEVTVTVPLTLPEDAGVKVTLKVALCPAVSVTGRVIPFRVNAVVLAEI